MRYYLICDNEDTLAGMRLAGIGGAVCASRREAEERIAAVRADESVAVLLITENCAALTPGVVEELRLSAHRPLVVVIPGPEGTTRSEDSITRLIRDAIGVKIV